MKFQFKTINCSTDNHYLKLEVRLSFTDGENKITFPRLMKFNCFYKNADEPMMIRYLEKIKKDIAVLDVNVNDSSIIHYATFNTYRNMLWGDLSYQLRLILIGNKLRDTVSGIKINFTQETKQALLDGIDEFKQNYLKILNDFMIGEIEIFENDFYKSKYSNEEYKKKYKEINHPERKRVQELEKEIEELKKKHAKEIEELKKQRATQLKVIAGTWDDYDCGWTGTWSDDDSGFYEDSDGW